MSVEVVYTAPDGYAFDQTHKFEVKLNGSTLNTFTGKDYFAQRDSAYAAATPLAKAMFCRVEWVDKKACQREDERSSRWMTDNPSRW